MILLVAVLLRLGVLPTLAFLLDVLRGGMAMFVWEKNCAAEGVLVISDFLILWTGIVILAQCVLLL
jgi:hypothetical protein